MLWLCCVCVCVCVCVVCVCVCLCGQRCWRGGTNTCPCSMNQSGKRCWCATEAVTHDHMEDWIQTLTRWKAAFSASRHWPDGRQYFQCPSIWQDGGLHFLRPDNDWMKGCIFCVQTLTGWRAAFSVSRQRHLWSLKQDQHSAGPLMRCSWCMEMWKLLTTVGSSVGDKRVDTDSHGSFSRWQQSRCWELWVLQWVTTVDTDSSGDFSGWQQTWHQQLCSFSGWQ